MRLTTALSDDGRGGIAGFWDDAASVESRTEAGMTFRRIIGTSKEGVVEGGGSVSVLRSIGLRWREKDRSQGLGGEGEAMLGLWAFAKPRFPAVSPAATKQDPVVAFRFV